MRLPNKVTSYSNSIIARFPDILDALEQRDISPKELFEQTATGNKDMGDFLSALDCLFALGKIELNEEWRVLHYADRNPM